MGSLEKGKPNFLQKTVDVFAKKGRGKKGGERQFPNGMIVVDVEDPFGIGGSEILFTRDGRTFKVSPVPDELVPNNEQEKVEDPGEINADDPRASVFVQGRFDLSGNGDVNTSYKRVPISVSNHPETFNK